MLIFVFIINDIGGFVKVFRAREWVYLDISVGLC